jgi:hypothetical protein
MYCPFLYDYNIYFNNIHIVTDVLKCTINNAVFSIGIYKSKWKKSCYGENKSWYNITDRYGGRNKL